MSTKIQERHFLEINKSNVKNHTGFGWGNQLKPIKINENQLKINENQ